MTTVVREYPRPAAPRRVLVRRWIASLCALGLSVAGFLWNYHGNPDPFALRLAGLAPVLTALPAGANIADVQLVEPAWDSCDGDPEGFDDVTVTADFAVGEPATVVLATLISSLRRLGWRPDVRGDPQAPSWSKTVQGSAADVQVFEPDGTTRSWSLQAEVAPAVHALPC